MLLGNEKELKLLVTQCCEVIVYQKLEKLNKTHGI